MCRQETLTINLKLNKIKNWKISNYFVTINEFQLKKRKKRTLRAN